MRIYLSGPMTGCQGWNFPAFHAAAAAWRSAGYEVQSPAEQFNGRTDLPREMYIREDIPALMNCEAVAVLPGWQASRGAVLEVAIARELGMPVYDARCLAPLQPYAETILEEAQRLVYGNRQATYGHPLDDMTRTALIWSAILGITVSAEQVALCMVGVKLSRECNKHVRDNLTDAAGYAACVDRIVTERARRRNGTEPDPS